VSSPIPFNTVKTEKVNEIEEQGIYVKEEVKSNVDNGNILKDEFIDKSELLKIKQFILDFYYKYSNLYNIFLYNLYTLFITY